MDQEEHNRQLKFLQKVEDILEAKERITNEADA
jgi:hypothetical protein